MRTARPLAGSIGSIEPTGCIGSVRFVSAALATASLALMLLMAGCATGPRGAPPGETRPGDIDARDGPQANPPADLDRVPDAEPRVEPIRAGGPNKPYEVLGQHYVPITQDRRFVERGLASWYGRKFHGKRTSSGEPYNMYAMTAAHPTLPIPSYARIRNPANGREVVVRINDRGPFHSSRIVDLSYTAALKLDVLRGVAPVELERITFEDIRTGAWRRDGDAVRMALKPADAPAAVVAVLPTPAPTPLPASAAPAAAPPAEATAAAPPTAAPAGVDTPIVLVASESSAAAPVAAPGAGFWVQLGAFRQRDGAESFQRRVAVELDWLSPLLGVFSDASLFRLQAGPYPSRDEARGVADRVRGVLQLVPVIVERR